MVWGLHSLVMQQATYWSNGAKWEEEKAQMARKALEDAAANTRKTQELLTKVQGLTEKLEEVAEAQSKVARDIIMLQRVVLDED
jgi:hypothetical protein